MGDFWRRRLNRDGRNQGPSWFFRAVAVLAVVFCFVAAAYLSIREYGNRVIPANSFFISKGDGISSLPSKWDLPKGESLRYYWYLKLFAPAIKLQVGTYSVPKGTTVSEAFESVLKKPTTLDVTITFLPGWTLFDIDDYISSQWVTKAWEISKPDKATLSNLSAKYQFLKDVESLEWFLYPDTYRIRPGSSAEEILNKALSNFNEKIYSKNSELGKDFYDTLILASIVEKEERSDKNRPIVAGVLAKRAEEGIALGADATVCYAYGLVRRDCTPAFIGEHITEKTPYNTRNKLGFPPTPISNVTVSSFRAARSPESSEYYYYLHDNDGIIRYGRNLEEHNRNKAKYLGR